jgi:hypothetical protein
MAPYLAESGIRISHVDTWYWKGHTKAFNHSWQTQRRITCFLRRDFVMHDRNQRGGADGIYRGGLAAGKALRSTVLLF